MNVVEPNATNTASQWEVIDEFIGASSPRITRR